MRTAHAVLCAVLLTGAGFDASWLQNQPVKTQITYDAFMALVY